MPYAFGYTVGAITAEACQPIPFAVFDAQPEDTVVQDNGTLMLVTPGIYLITALLHVPPAASSSAQIHIPRNGQRTERPGGGCEAQIDTTVYLLLNGSVLPGTQTRIRSGEQTVTAIIRAQVVSDGTAAVSLAAADALSLAGAQADDVLASISFLRLA